MKYMKDELFMYLRLNMKLMPIDRGNIFEDPLNEVLMKNEVGEVTGGGTFLDKDGKPTSCDIEIKTTTENKDKVISFLKKLDIIAKKSYIEINGEKIEIGASEGLSLGLNGTDLEQEIYDTYDSNILLEEIEEKLGDNGRYYSYYVGDKYTYLYFYGSSYSKMKEIIEEYTKTSPICEKCVIEPI